MTTEKKNHNPSGNKKKKKINVKILMTLITRGFFSPAAFYKICNPKHTRQPYEYKYNTDRRLFYITYYFSGPLWHAYIGYNNNM